MFQRAYLGLFLLAFVVLLGCGAGKTGLSGKVTFSDDQSPVPAGMIVFEGSDGKMGRAEIQSDGTYRAGFDSAKDGLPKGTYKVYLTNVVRTEKDARGMDAYIPLLDSKYSSTTTSGLTFNADGKTPKFDFSVDRAK